MSGPTLIVVIVVGHLTADANRPTGIILAKWKGVEMDLFSVAFWGVLSVGGSLLAMLIIVILAYELTK